MLLFSVKTMKKPTFRRSPPMPEEKPETKPEEKETQTDS